MKKLLTAISLISLYCLLNISVVTASDRAEVIHWWISGSEANALQVIIDRFEGEGNLWLDTPVKASYQAKSVAVARMLDGNPPTMIQWHAGVALDELYKENLVRDITAVAEQAHWQDVLPPVVWDRISVEGRVIAVPLTIHGSNWIWGNRKVLEEVGQPMPETWEDFFKIAPAIQKAGYTPLVLGGDPWQIRVLFNNVLLAVGGPELYQAAIVDHNSAAVASPAMAEVFEVFGRLRQYTDYNDPKRSWSDATKMVIDGKAAFIVMGDWAKGEFIRDGMVPGEDFLCSIGPGSHGYYLIVTDVFAMPILQNKEDRAVQDELARLIMEPEIQRRFNIIKGSIPPRNDVSTDGFDDCARMAIQSTQNGKKVLPGFSMANRGVMGNTLMDGIASYWRDPHITPDQAAKTLAENIEKARF